MEFPRNDFIKEAKRLGHSDAFVEELLNYADSLERKNIPVIIDQQHLASIFMMERSSLQSLILRLPSYYKYFVIKKKNGGLRRIMAPYTNLRIIQTWIKNNILDQIEQPFYVTAYVKGRNTLFNAKIHENKRFILKLDIKNFFESIDVKKVYKIFCNLGYEKGVASWLSNLCTSKIDEYKYSQLEEKIEIQELFNELVDKKTSFLIQGAPTSPGLANIACFRMDKRIMGLANKFGFNYSRYADDMTFSADDFCNLPKIGMLKRIIESEGFYLNFEKIKLLSKGKRQIVTGLLVNGDVRIPGKYIKDIKRHIYFCLKYGGRNHFNRLSPNHAYGKEWLEGKIRYVYSIEPAVAMSLWNDFEKIDWGY